MSTSGLWEPVSPMANYVAVTPTGGISATNLQDALTELDTEKVAKAGDTMTGTLAMSGAGIALSGNISATAWTTNGLRFKSTAGTLTDTSSSGTVATACTNKLGGNTIAASNATTFTDYGTLYLDAPAAGANVTLTNVYSLIATSNIKCSGFFTGALKNITETLYSITTSGNVTIAPANGNVQRFILDAARQFTLPADPGAVAQSLVLIIDCATYTPTWNSSPPIKWLTLDSAAPSLNTASGKRNVITFVWDDTAAGTGYWLGFLAGKET